MKCAVSTLVVAVLIGSSSRAMAQAPAPLLDDTIDATEVDEPRRKLINFNEIQGPFGSLRVGFGVLYDYASFDQDQGSKEQFDSLESGWKYRDGRILFSGRMNFNRPTTWSAGVMYDGAKEKWVMRQTGIMVAVPEIWGHIFVGRSKEGFSLNKVMVGYAGWTHERAPVSDAMVPLLADGVKWLGYVPKARIIWNLGWFGDAVSEGQSFSSYESQVVGRFAWVPMQSADGGNLIHLGVSERFGTPNDGKLRLRARPGAWAAPYFVDTGEFAADSTNMTGLEAYVRPRNFTFGTEYFFQNVNAPDAGDPSFHGGDVMASWLITGEVRAYNTKGGYFNQISPNRTVMQGGVGAWELVAHYSTVDLDDGTIAGGKYKRFTPMVNWYVSDNVRLEFIYGYGVTDRFGLIGKTKFFQTRLQFQL
jgi:phosphate-selective porin OprO/OprP